MKQTVDILGGGPGGLACAYYLCKLRPGIGVRLWEAEETPGGLAGTFRTDQFEVEKFYHHIFTKDRDLITLADELGLSAQLRWMPASTGSWYFGKPYKLSSPLDLLRFGPLSFVDRIRLGWLVLHAKTVNNWERLDEETARDYVIRISGRRVYQKVWEPLLRGKFGAHADSVSAAWLWSKFRDRGGSRDAQGREVLGYLQGGLSVLFDAMVSEIRSCGGEVRLGEKVTGLDIEDNKIRQVETASGKYKTDQVISALQLPALTALLPDSQSAWKQDLNRIAFLGNVCLIWLLDRPLSDLYWNNITDPEAPFVGLIEQTNWAPAAEYGGGHLVYLSAYMPQEDARMRMSAAELTQAYLPWVQKMFPDFDASSIRDQWAWSAPYTQAIVSRGYGKLRPPLQSPVSNLKICTMAQIFPQDRQVSNAIGMGKQIAASWESGKS